jgi:cyclin H
MFNTSTQKSKWLFKDVNELIEQRKKSNENFIRRQTADRNYLTYEEEKIILIHYEYLLKQFCGHFQPPITMPSVVGTSITYFKRFYLRNSVMDWHPKDIYYVCVYLACKIEEFNISISQFVQNITNTNENKEELANMILSYELLLMEKLDFHLNVHNFYRPFEGFLLDVKTRCPEIANVDVLRHFGMEFLDKILNTDAILLYPPSQIALTAIVYSASKNKIDLDRYCKEILLSQLNHEEVKQFLTIIKNINKLHKEIPVLNIEEIKRIDNKLIQCYNIENDPRSKTFKDKTSKMLEDEDDE